MCRSPLLGDVSPHLTIHLLRKLYEYRLEIDILFGISAEVSCPRSFRTIRTCTLCCCFCLLLLSFLHQRNRRRFVLPICSIDCCCSTKCSVAICIRYTYSTDAERLVRSILQCCLLLYERVMCCARWRKQMSLFLVFPAFSFSSLKIVFYNAPLGSTVALTASSCMPYAFSHYGHARSRRRASARRGEALLVYIWRIQQSRKSKSKIQTGNPNRKSK